MGVKVREWKGAWWVFVNHRGQRKAKRVGEGKAGKRAASEAAVKIQARLALGEPAVTTAKTTVKFEEYAEKWLDRIKHSRKYSTYFGYQKMLVREWLPVLRSLTLDQITRDKIKQLACASLANHHSPKTVQSMIRGLSSLLSHAVEDGLIPTNPALKPGKFLPPVSKRRGINPLTRDEVSRLLAYARANVSRYYTLFLCAVRAGLRMGELIALQWDDIDFYGRFIEVRRNCALRRLTTPKNGESRRVDMSKELTQALKDLQTERQLEAAANGWTAIPEWVFCTETGTMLDADNIRKRTFYSLLKACGLRRVRFHDLRHTFASLLL